MTTYSLAGIRTATTAPQDALIRRVTEVLYDDERILAGFLVGGFAIGQGDAFSDVDLQFVVADDAVDDLRESWVGLLDRIAVPAHVQPFGWVIGGSVITPEWLHYDVVFNPRASIDIGKVEGMVPLFDKAGLLPAESVPRPDRRREPFFPEQAIQHFLYMLGNIVAVIGRDEPLLLSNGVIVTRDMCLVRLLLAEQGWENTREHTFGNPFPFTKRLHGYLTDEQNGLLESLPPVEATIESGIASFIALARIFLPRAKALAERTGATWPASYEEASVGFFERMTGANLDLDA